MKKYINKLIVAYSRSENPTSRLFCLPYAGGSASIFSSWIEDLPQLIEIIALELPGHGSRWNEEPYDDMESLVYNLIGKLSPLFDLPYSIYGHSLGGLIGYQIICNLTNHGLRLPEHFIVAACRTPTLKYKYSGTYKLSNFQLKSRLAEIGGTPDIILNDKKLFNRYLPLLRADFKLAEYVSSRKLNQISLNAHILYGTKDHIVKEQDILDWSQFFLITKYYKINAGHFFIHQKRQIVLKYINDILGGFVS